MNRPYRDELYQPPPLSQEEYEAAQQHARQCYDAATADAADQRRREDAGEPDPLPDVDLPW